MEEENLTDAEKAMVEEFARRRSPRSLLKDLEKYWDLDIDKAWARLKERLSANLPEKPDGWVFVVDLAHVQYHFLTLVNFYSMAIRAKFHCNSITDNGYGKSANLTAVYGDKGENADFAKATPSGTLNINIDKGTNAADFFIPQKNYFLTFEEAE